MIGQERLLERIDQLIANNKLPRFSIVVGERGMEHEDVAYYIADKMGADCIHLQDVKVDTVRIMIQQAYKLHHPTVFCIPHADDMSINAKNAMLKVVEDAPNKAYFVMCLEDINNTLATIQSRGIVFQMDRCKPKDIREFAKSLYVDKEDIKKSDLDMIADICNTPGDVYMLTKYGVKNFYAYAKYVVENMVVMSGAEVFKLSDKLALKDEEEKYDVRLFLKAIQSALFNELSDYEHLSDNIEAVRKKCRMSAVISKYAQDLRIKGINRTMLMDNLFLEVRRIWKSQT